MAKTVFDTANDTQLDKQSGSFWGSSPLLGAGISAGALLLGNIFSAKAADKAREENQQYAQQNALLEFERQKELLRLRDELGSDNGGGPDRELERRKLIMAALQNMSGTTLISGERVADQASRIGNAAARAYLRGGR